MIIKYIKKEKFRNKGETGIYWEKAVSIQLLEDGVYYLPAGSEYYRMIAFNNLTVVVINGEIVHGNQ